MRLRVILPVLLLVLAIGLPRVMDPHTWLLLHAVRELGPLSGWRCVDSDIYVYDPSRERPDATLLAQAPEEAVLAQVPSLEIDRVEANLRGGDALVTAHGPDDERVYVLAPGRLKSITTDDASFVCNVQLADWHIVGEEQLG